MTPIVTVRPQAVSSVNWFVPRLRTVPTNLPSPELEWPAGNDGNCETLTPFVAARFTERSDWMIVFRWMSSCKATGVFAVTVSGKGAEEKVSVKGVVVGVNWQTELFAQAPMAEPVPLKIVSCGLAKVRLRLV